MTWEGARVGLAVCAVGLFLGFILGGLDLPGWLKLAILVAFAWFGTPVVVRAASRRVERHD